MRRYLVAALALLALVVLPGVVVKRGPPSTPQTLWMFTLNDGSVSAVTELVPVNATTGTPETSVNAWQYLPDGTSLTINQVSFLVTTLLTATEDCSFQVVSNTDETDTDIDNATVHATTLIITGPNGSEASCDAGAITLDAVGELCTISGISETISEGSRWGVDIVDSGGGTCTVFQGGLYVVRGKLL